MVPDEAPKAATEQADSPRGPYPPRRGRRSGRGRRGGRGRRPPMHSSGQHAPHEQGDSGSAKSGSQSVAMEKELPNRPGMERRPASPATMQETIEEVNQIIDTLREALDDMDEVLETLEAAQRQQSADEQ